MSNLELRGAVLLVVIICVAHGVSWGIRSSLGNSNKSGSGATLNGSSDADSLEQWTKMPWKLIGIFKGVETFVKSAPGGSGLHAFRGVTTIDAHISAATAHFYDVSLASEWIDMLHDIREYSWPVPTDAPPSDISSASEQDRLVYDQAHYARSRSSRKLAPVTDTLQETDLVYEILDMPWPVAPRDMLLMRDFTYDYASKSVTIQYRSVEDPVRSPRKPGTIRALSPHTLWRFKALPGGHTRLEIECLVDSGGSLPAMLINFFQRSFPSKALTAFGKLVKKNKVPPHRRVVDW